MAANRGMSRRMCAPPNWQLWMRLPAIAKSTAGSVTVESSRSQPDGTMVPAGRVIASACAMASGGPAASRT